MLPVQRSIRRVQGSDVVVSVRRSSNVGVDAPVGQDRLEHPVVRLCDPEELPARLGNRVELIAESRIHRLGTHFDRIVTGHACRIGRDNPNQAARQIVRQRYGCCGIRVSPVRIPQEPGNVGLNPELSMKSVLDKRHCVTGYRLIPVERTEVAGRFFTGTTIRPGDQQLVRCVDPERQRDVDGRFRRLVGDRELDPQLLPACRRPVDLVDRHCQLRVGTRRGRGCGCGGWRGRGCGCGGWRGRGCGCSGWRGRGCGCSGWRGRRRGCSGRRGRRRGIRSVGGKRRLGGPRCHRRPDLGRNLLAPVGLGGDSGLRVRCRGQGRHGVPHRRGHRGRHVRRRKGRRRGGRLFVAGARSQRYQQGA